MYIKTQQFEARYRKLASSSCLPTHRLQNAMLHGNSSREFYEPEAWNNRSKIRSLLMEVIAERKATAGRAERESLIRLERRIESDLGGQRLLRPQPTKTFSKCFMDAAEATLNHDVFLRIKAIALEKYGNDMRAGVDYINSRASSDT